MEQNNFSEFSFHPIMQNVIERLGFKEPTEIQKKAIPSILKGTSVIGQSRTGSGKTHAFLLPMFNQIDTNKKEVQFVITAPTRELATQLYDEVKRIIHYADREKQWVAKLLIGGTDKQKMAEKLKQPPHIIVGTPGRILDLVKDEAVSIYSAKSFVVDEADLMLDMGFITDVDQLLVRSAKDIQLLVFSATIPQRLQHFFRKYLENPLYIKVKDHFSPETMEHQLVALKHRDEAQLLFEISKTIQPYLAIIFTNGKEKANQLAESLQQKGLKVGLIHGGLAPRERKRVLKEIQNLRYQYIVATDLASRGIDIKGVSHVINAQLPKEEDFYIHRVGRTARAGMEGTAISIYQDDDIKLIQKLEQKGLTFTYTDLRKGEWMEAKPWNQRKLRTNTTTDVEQEAWKRVKKAKKVKPGYKKKMKYQQTKIKREMTRKNKFKK
ncbi:DEAD-box ATP-dependent RNA helicase CshB [Oceanobacillus picturae]|uniref:DEAD-box ATP-dependent RNA helicase CshB n=1 Tax=Oceanobacillus picturae TaxID=171693 RepID=W9B583_9BACI|nr:DEAD/DEAH box helicase [Oceanobacillus picturae]RIU93546.1 DEAD/DEAH box helicase [Oceanobacillus picturae]GAQ19296.1 DEAD-box ATP-dependent RNA helicase CshB [Oceanobacillus picturae]CDO01875.1 DEAD-box ATP-dependent RNA helicase CshB [Oceanobacillus picturae]